MDSRLIGEDDGRSPLTDDRAGRLFSTTTANYTTPRWLAEKVKLRKIPYQSGIHKEPTPAPDPDILIEFKSVSL